MTVQKAVNEIIFIIKDLENYQKDIQKMKSKTTAAKKIEYDKVGIQISALEMAIEALKHKNAIIRVSNNKKFRKYLKKIKKVAKIEYQN